MLVLLVLIQYFVEMEVDGGVGEEETEIIGKNSEIVRVVVQNFNNNKPKYIEIFDTNVDNFIKTGRQKY